MELWKRKPQSIKTYDGDNIENPFDLQKVLSDWVLFKLRKGTPLLSPLKFSWPEIGNKLISCQFTLTICVDSFFSCQASLFSPSHASDTTEALNSLPFPHAYIYVYIFHWFACLCPEYDSLWAHFSVWYSNHRLTYSGCQKNFMHATNNISIDFLKNSKPWTKNI